MDQVDANIQCIRLRRHRTGGEVQRLSLARKYGIVVLDSIRGKVQTVRRDTVIGSIYKSNATRLNDVKVCDDVPGWEYDLFTLKGSPDIGWNNLMLQTQNNGYSKSVCLEDTPV